MDRQEKDKEFGRIAIEQGFITLINFEEAMNRLQQPEYQDKSLVEYLVEKRLINTEQISQVIAIQNGANPQDFAEAAEQNSSSQYENRHQNSDSLKRVEDLFNAGEGEKNLGIAIIINLFWPGAGYFYLGKPQKAIGLMLATLLLSWTFFVPIGIFIYACIDSSKIVKEQNHT